MENYKKDFMFDGEVKENDTEVNQNFNEHTSNNIEELMDFQKFKESMNTKYGNIYAIAIDFEIDDDARQTLKYCFKKPLVYSYDRYVKGLSKSPTKASKTFVLDNIVDEQKSQIIMDLEKYPAIAIGISDKLLAMLGLGEVTLKKL